MRNRNYVKAVILALSLLLGAAGTCVCAGHLPSCSPAPMAQMAWWSGIYPEYCMPGAMKAVEETDGSRTADRVSVKITFKYLKFLNE